MPRPKRADLSEFRIFETAEFLYRLKRIEPSVRTARGPDGVVGSR